MLVPAVSVKAEIERKFSEHMYDEDMFLYNGYAHCNRPPDFTPKENNYQWAIIKDNEVIGYFSYYIDVAVDTVCNFGLYSFKTDSQIGIDVFKKIKELIKTYRRIEWRMIGGNPVKCHYDKLCAHYGGNCVMLHQVCRDPQGNYRDEYIYEIVKEV